MTPFLRAYFSFRHLVPRPARLFLRRQSARRKRERLKHLWPIDPTAGQEPEQWAGWPEGKRFAFLLTHDVEGEKGLRRVKALAELEMELGFRSAFFFVPEGSYEVPMDLVIWLKENGFEVGVHDLHHDGKLFESEESFRASARRINHYIHKWGASGYRSGFMLRNLDWLHHLDVEYDASTFDTDPFEPQPDGAGTIFPFWIANEADVEVLQPQGQDNDEAKFRTRRAGYVELPYSIPQDSTVFLLFKEPSADIWRRKLDWVAKRGGMALLNVHPDYINLNGGASGATEFPAQHYRDLLGRLRDVYRDQYWAPLPKELAAWFKRSVGREAEALAAER